MRSTLTIGLLALLAGSLLAGETAAPKKIVLIAGKKSHGPGAHDYERTMRLFKVMLDNSNVASRIAVEVHKKDWPEDPTTLDSADTIVFYSDGRDGDKYVDVPFVRAGRMEVLEKQMRRGCGLMLMHFSTFVSDKEGEKVLEWAGGYFDWEGEPGERKWFSRINQGKTLELATPEHDISRGVAKTITLNDEVYWNMRFRPTDKRITPIWNAGGLDHDAAVPLQNTVGWAVQRDDGGRAFATSAGHSYRLWQDENVRRAFLNAIVWSAKAEVPAAGVETHFFSDEQVAQALKNASGTQKARVDEPAPAAAPEKRSEAKAPLRVLLFAGNAAHKWHNWERTTPAIRTALEKSGDILVDTSLDMEDLTQKNMADYHAVVLNSYCNWQDPKGLSDGAKKAFLDYLRGGGGLLILHFANGAFNFSLPQAAESDWPEFRKIVRRVWNHQGKDEAKSGHDSFGKFQVDITAEKHEITAGLAAFSIEDELYFKQDGSEPVVALLSAASKATGRIEPLAWTYTYEKARVFQSLLGHSEKTYDAPETCEMLRRAVKWAARPQHTVAKP